MKVKVNVSEARLDIFLQQNLKQYSRSHIKKMIDGGLVKVNDKIITKSGYKVIESDEIEYTDLPTKKLDTSPEDIDINIVYEDDDLVVINKPQGLVVHPACGNENHTLVNALLYNIKDLSGINGEIRPGIVHRLDKDTSGLIIVAKNDTAHVDLAKQIQQKICKRIYIALVYGNITKDEGTIQTYLGRGKIERKKIFVVRQGEGKLAITNFKVLQRFKGYTLVEYELKTGRTHQIRVHSAYIGHPIVGDKVYFKGEDKTGLKGQLLHAYKISFYQPTTKQLLSFSVPLPNYFENFLQHLKN